MQLTAGPGEPARNRGPQFKPAVRRSIAAGIGIGEIPVYTGERDGLVRLWPDRTRPLPYDVWLVTHADLRHTARVRVVIDEIVAAFAGTGE